MASGGADWLNGCSGRWLALRPFETDGHHGATSTPERDHVSATGSVRFRSSPPARVAAAKLNSDEVQQVGAASISADKRLANRRDPLLYSKGHEAR